jgi:hypothetical protein
MCDFSLRHVLSREARRGEQLVSTEFGSAAARGFAAIGDPNVAVCIPPGTELAFDCEVECDHPLAPYPVTRHVGRVARFRRVNPDSPYEHHDALEFASGEVVLLARLRPGQRAKVLQMPATPAKIGRAPRHALNGRS